MSTFQILHISDLHISTKEVFDASIVLDPFFGRLDEDKRESGLAPEIVVVTGDVACNGDEKEYDLAKIFFDRLLSKLCLSSDRLFIVPGNHDLKRTKLKTTLNIKEMKEVNELLEDQDTRNKLLEDLEKYFLFIEGNYEHLKSNHGRLVPFIKRYRSVCGKQIGLVGLNSAWVGKKSPFRDKMIIGEYQMVKTKEELSESGDVDIIINIFHHPLDYLWEIDRSICMKHFNNTILLTGHFHGGVVSEFHDDLLGSYHQFKAGGLYIGSGSEHPNRFQYITFDWNNNKIRLYFRKFDKEERKWCPESERGTDGVKRFPLGIRRGDVEDIHPEVIPEIPDSYKNWIKCRCDSMDIQRLGGKGKVIHVGLPEIFIPLYAYPPGNKHNIQKAHHEFRAEKDFLDIDVIAGENEYLLIEGHPGYGKTTLLKHLAYSLIEGCKPKNLDGFMPVLVFLKELKGFFEHNENVAQNAKTAESILTFYFNATTNGLNMETVKAYCRIKKAIFLLDGLDEIISEQRAIVVNSIANFMNHSQGNKLLFSSRPHGLDDNVMQKFGRHHISILPLNMEQVKLFIKNWARHLHPEDSTAQENLINNMLSDIKPDTEKALDIDKIIDNPLMLTAVCILYHDDKRIPDQRAELYKKFIDHLVYKKFSDAGKVLDFLKKLAFEIHSKGGSGTDRTVALSILKEIYKKEDKESEESYKERIEHLFDNNIEPNCGLLKFENGQHCFAHLTFQEFLTALYIVDNNTDYNKAIEEYWGNDRYKEVIELYIGYLSIENKTWANQIVRNIVENGDKKPFKEWLLASKSLIDIHKDRRDEEVLEKSRNRLLEIIDTDAEPKILVEAGETLGWLGDTRNLKEFIRVAGGKYELSKGEVEIKPFELGKYPVTNSWFEEFIKAGGYKNMNYWTEEGKKRLEYTKAEKPAFWNERKWKCPNAPVVGVSWYEAFAFTSWLTSLCDGYEYWLPDEDEWEAAATGFEKREYPWGNAWDKTKCNNYEIKIEKTSPVGIFKRGNTPEGILDMSGNVWEWTLSNYHSRKKLNDFTFDEEIQKIIDERNYGENLLKFGEKDLKLPVVRGGSWINASNNCRCTNRRGYNPYRRSNGLGFRCARTLKP